MAQAVSALTGIKIAPVGTPQNPTPSAPSPSGPLRPNAKNLTSPALSQDKPGQSITGRKIAVLACEGVDAADLAAIRKIISAAGALTELVAAQAGLIADSAGKRQPVDRPAANAASVLYDAVIIPGGTVDSLSRSGWATRFVDEAYRHGKPIAALGAGTAIFDACSFAAPQPKQGVITGEGKAAIDDLAHALLSHRFPRRAIEPHSV